MTRAIGTVENGHVLTAHLGWVRLNLNPPDGGPWRPGDVVGGHAFTGERWTALPSGWLPDPTGRHHFRWWTGQFWSQHALTNGQPIYDPMSPQATSATSPTSDSGLRTSRTSPTSPTSWRTGSPPVSPQTALQTVGILWSSIGRIATFLYCGSWFVVALYSLSVVVTEDDPRWLVLTATASGNVFAYKLNMTYGELKRRLRKEMKAKMLYATAGAVLAGGVWLSLHFDDPGVLTVTAPMVLIVLMFAWVFN